MSYWSKGSVGADGLVELSESGVDNGNGTKPILLWAREVRPGVGTIVTIRIPGGKHWSGLGQPWVSHPGRLLVGIAHDETQDGFRFTKLIDLPLSGIPESGRRAGEAAALDAAAPPGGTA